MAESFFTDSSGIEFVERFRKQGVKNQNVPASTYPVNTAVGIISAEGFAMVVLNDRPQGATSTPSKGRIEIFITRKTATSDFGGMGGMLNKVHELALDFKLLLTSGTNV